MIFSIVLDPWLKLSYYRDHGWERQFVEAAKKQINDLYNTQYAPTRVDVSVSQEESLDDALLQHIYKRRRVENVNELDQYLKAPLAPAKIDVLQWWKV